MRQRPAPCRETTQRYYKSSHGPAGAQNNTGDAQRTDQRPEQRAYFSSQLNHDRLWIITMTLEEIHEQENAMENTDR